jgi:endonuclease/exonuclease/phosphatase (EEP) superfamily protein YafD
MALIQRKIRSRKPRVSYASLITHLREAWKISPIAIPQEFLFAGTTFIEDLDPASIRVGVWNMCKGVGGVLFEHDFRIMCYRCDLLLTQEALISPHSLATFAQPGLQIVHAGSYYRRDGLRDGVMTLSRAELSGEPRRVICKYPEPIFGTPKVALVTKYKIKGFDLPLMVINIHATLVRRKAVAIEEIEYLLTHLPPHEGPMILGGDFNTFTPRYLNGIRTILAGIGLEWVPIMEDPRSYLKSLDQIFIRGLKVKKALVGTTYQSSDHFPLLFDFEVLSEGA